MQDDNEYNFVGIRHLNAATPAVRSRLDAPAMVEEVGKLQVVMTSCSCASSLSRTVRLSRIRKFWRLTVRAQALVNRWETQTRIDQPVLFTS
jgi:hypothetical protein